MEERYNAYSFLLDRTAKRVKQYAQKRFKEMGFNVTVDQWLVLKQLDERKEIKQNELAGIVFKDNPTLTRIIDLLAKKGLAERRAHPGDRRSYMVSLTSKGKKKVRELRPKIKEVRLKAWEGLTTGDFKQFSKVLNTIYQNLSTEKA
jgi:DNA-binding MarR family transcriptional regulator